MKELSTKITPTPEAEPLKVTPVTTSPFTETKEVTETKDRPYPADYFQIPEWGKMILEPELDAHGVKDKIVFIETILSQNMTKHGMKVDREAMFAQLAEIEETLKLTPGHLPHIRVAKIHDYLKTVHTHHLKKEERERKIRALKNKFVF